MPNSAKYQVFISSTYEDLKDERDQVIRAVLEMGHIPVGMEMFSAADDEQWQIIARHIEESDYYAVVIAHRLGSLTETGISYTRKEYEYAASKGIPTLGFIIDEKASWPADQVDSNTSTKLALEDFKTLIRAKPVSFWSNADDLYGRFSVALMKAFTANPREGWVRASSARTAPEVTAEIIRLSSENAALRQEVQAAIAAAARDEQDELDKTKNTLLATMRKPSYRHASNGEWLSDARVSLFDVFSILGGEMLIDSSLTSMAGILAMSIRTDKTKPWDTVAHNQVKGLLADFLTLGLVKPSTRKHAVKDTEDYWSLSSFGNRVFQSIRKSTLVDTTSSLVPDEISPGEAGEADLTSNVDG